MTEELEFKKIKKLYGEELMHIFQRGEYATIRETPGKLLKILTDNIAPTRLLASDIKSNNLYEEFKDWIYSFVDVEKNYPTDTNKTPFELMDEAGYTLYECKTEEDIQSFRKYYDKLGQSSVGYNTLINGCNIPLHIGEELCTFDGRRLDRCYVFFAVKKNVDTIKREEHPKREDDYGRSVISIQFSKGDKNTLSIKNRYNHTVNNPDATYSNNLENIIPGLTNSFEKYYGLNIVQNEHSSSDFLTNNLQYVKGNDGKYYRCNREYRGICYCENNIIIDYEEIIDKYAKNPERYIFMDEYILDLSSKTITLFHDSIIECNQKDSDDSFIKSINDIGTIKDISVTKNGYNKEITITYDDNKQVKIEIDKYNNIIGYENKYIKTIGKGFLWTNSDLKRISLLNVETIDSGFLYCNTELTNISAGSVQKIGVDFLKNHPNKEKIMKLLLPLDVSNEKLNFLKEIKSVINDKIEENHEETNNKQNR